MTHVFTILTNSKVKFTEQEFQFLQANGGVTTPEVLAEQLEQQTVERILRHTNAERPFVSVDYHQEVE